MLLGTGLCPWVRGSLGPGAGWEVPQIPADSSRDCPTFPAALCKGKSCFLLAMVAENCMSHLHQGAGATQASWILPIVVPMVACEWGRWAGGCSFGTHGASGKAPMRDGTLPGPGSRVPCGEGLMLVGAERTGHPVVSCQHPACKPQAPPPALCSRFPPPGACWASHSTVWPIKGLRDLLGGWREGKRETWHFFFLRSWDVKPFSDQL